MQQFYYFSTSELGKTTKLVFSKTTKLVFCALNKKNHQVRCFAHRTKKNQIIFLENYCKQQTTKFRSNFHEIIRKNWSEFVSCSFRLNFHEINWKLLPFAKTCESERNFYKRTFLQKKYAFPNCTTLVNIITKSMK